MDNQDITLNQNLNQKERVSPKHVFLHLFVIIMLYATTINFLILVFQYINVWLPDPLSNIDYYVYNNLFGIIRFALAFFIIVFPVFILTSWFLNKSYSKNPAIKEMKTRKWLIYFTLFAAALIIIGDLVRIVLIFLEGEITLRFILKAISVLFVTAVIFGYYLREVKKEEKSAYHKYFIWAIILIAVITIIAGFFVIGSPKKERLRRFDQERINQLSEIQWQITNYWQKKERLPEKLSDLKDEISGYEVPFDPETKQPYEYIIKNPETLTFELCAVFSELGSPLNAINPQPARVPMNDISSNNWSHPAGYYCFERTIDKELYPPYSSGKAINPILKY